MSVDAFQVLATVLISFFTAVSGGWIAMKRFNREEKN